MTEESAVPQTTLTVSTFSRPKRIAFLVHPETTTDAEIDQIIRFSTGVWGGKFHAIIPSDGKEIAPDWWKLLQFLDPDIIQSFLPLNESLIDRINRHILPSKITMVTPEDRKLKGESNLIDIHGIGALGIDDIPRHAWVNRGFLGDPFFFHIKDSWENSEDRTFILRNFGTLSTSGPMEDVFRDTDHEVIDSGEVTAENIMGDLLKLRPRKTSILPIDLCRMYVDPHAYMPSPSSFSGGFHLVVGDNPLDVIYSWNRALISEHGLGRDVFWLSEKMADNETMLQLVGEWIKHTHWSQDRQGIIVSYSMSLRALQRIADKIKPLIYFHFQPRKLAPNNFPHPGGSLERPHPGGFMQRRFMEHHTEQVPFSQNQGLVGFPRPPFLSKKHPDSGWMVDMEIPYHPERYAYTDVRPNWKLPKRLGLANKFFSSSRTSRIVYDGMPSTAVASTDKTVGIRIPSDIEVVRSYLDRRHTNLKNNRPCQRESSFTNIYISDKGQYLQGLLRLFGNVQSAGQIFEDPFWRDVLLLMAGRPNKKLRRYEKEVLSALEEVFGQGTIQIAPEDPRIEQAAKTLVRRLPVYDTKTKARTRPQFKLHFGKLRKEALLDARSNTDFWETHTKFDDDKDYELQCLLQDGIFLQGTELVCPHCGTREWYPVDDLHADMRCNGCSFGFPLPPSPKWSFRLNSLVGAALRKHGTLAVIQTLYELERWQSGMFLFLPCHDIFKRGEEEPFTDLDIIVIREGKFIIGEVKSSPRGFGEKDFAKLREVAEDLLPDEVLLAAPGDRWPPIVHEEIKKFKKALAALDIDVSARLLRWD